MVERIEYDEFGLFHENAAEYGLPYDGPPTVRREFVPIDADRRLSALVWGDGEPELVLLHGGSQNAHTWDTVAMALGRPLVAIDLPGHGHSDGAGERPQGQLSVQGNAEDVAVAIRALAPNAAAVVGMSLGGLTTIALTGEAPDLVRKVVLVDVTPGVNPAKSKQISDFVNGPPSFASFDELLARTIQYNPTRTESSLRRGILHNAVQREDGTWVWRWARWREGMGGGRRRRRGGPAQAAGPVERADRPARSSAPCSASCGTCSARSGCRCMLARGMLSQSVVGDEDEAELLRRLAGRHGRALRQGRPQHPGRYASRTGAGHQRLRVVLTIARPANPVATAARRARRRSIRRWFESSVWPGGRLATASAGLPRFRSGADSAGASRSIRPSPATFWSPGAGTSDLIAALARRVSWVHIMGTGIDWLPPEAFDAKVLTCARGGSAVAISEFVLAAMLSFEKQLPELWTRPAEAGVHPGRTGHFDGRQLGLIGMGGIGAAIAARALAFGMSVRAVRRHEGPAPVPGVRMAGLEEVLAGADHLVLAAPDTPETHQVIGPASLGLGQERRPPHQYRPGRTGRPGGAPRRPRRRPRGPRHPRRVRTGAAPRRPLAVHASAGAPYRAHLLVVAPGHGAVGAIVPGQSRPLRARRATGRGRRPGRALLKTAPNDNDHATAGDARTTRRGRPAAHRRRSVHRQPRPAVGPDRHVRDRDRGPRRDPGHRCGRGPGRAGGCRRGHKRRH